MIEIFGSVTVALITALLGPAAILWVQKKLKAPKDDLKIEMISIEKITTEIEDILNKLNCDRVWVTQIHNGGHFLHSNKSMQKFSVVYEVDGPGILPVASIFTNMPISLYSRFFIEIMSTGFVGIHNYCDPTVATFGLKQSAEATGANASYIVGLFDFGSGKLIGSIGVDYLEPTVISEQDLSFFKKKSERLAGYLSTRNH